MLVCDHPIEWVQTKPDEMADFKDKGLPMPEYGPGICPYLQDNYALSLAGVIGECQTATTLHNMIGDTGRAKFPIL